MRKILFVLSVLFLLTPVLAANPVCTLISQTPSDIEADSTGVFTAIINCTDADGINESSIIITRTLEGFAHEGIPNFWSVRPPSNNASNYNITITNETILRADGRGNGDWYESIGLFNDNFTYAAADNTSIRISTTSGATWTTINYTWNVEPVAFRSSLFLSRGMMEKEEKTGQEYEIYSDNPLLIKFWDLEAMRNELNYIIRIFRNIDYSAAPNKNLDAWYCNETYNPAGSIKPPDSVNCVFANSLSTTDLNDITYTSRNSSYSQAVYAVTNGEFAGVTATDNFYIYYESDVNYEVGYYQLRYADGASGTNVSFADTDVAWSSVNDGETWAQASFTPDIWFAAVKSGDEFWLGIFVEDSLGNNMTNLSFVHDDIGDVNHAITKPSIEWYISNSTATFDYYLNGTHNETMTIRILMATDPDGVGTVEHALYLANADGSWNYTINGSFYSADDADLNITFNTNAVPDGMYRMNISAVADDDSGDFESFLTFESFEIDNIPPDIDYELAVIIALLGVAAVLIFMAVNISDNLRLLQPLFIGVAIWILVGSTGIALELINVAEQTNLYNMYIPFYRAMMYVGYIAMAIYFIFGIIVRFVVWLGGVIKK